ncbi:hypothetical protein PIB30_089193, partial [Stylosanthes scabra]|nr:hypothetical protein [Stylosanthes scabra]
MAKPAAASSSCWVWFLSVAALIHISSSSSSRCYTAIYSFGDSIADTGNIYYDTDEHLPTSTSMVLNPPYGQTFFHYPTGRYSDGRLIIDFLAEQMGVPMLKPYLGIKKGKIKDWNSLEGVNFAVGGATALDIVPTSYSLGVQLDWFMELLPSICNSSSGNDPIVPFSSGSKVPQLPTLLVLRKFSLWVFTAGVNSATHLKTPFPVIFSQNRRRRRARKDPKPWDTKFRSERRFVELETRSPEKLAGKRTSCRSSKVEDDHVIATSSPHQRHVIATSAARHRHIPLRFCPPSFPNFILAPIRSKISN